MTERSHLVLATDGTPTDRPGNVNGQPDGDSSLKQLELPKAASCYLIGRLLLLGQTKVC